MVHCRMIKENQTKHILIVDDSLEQQFLLKILLEAKGYTTQSTLNGWEALRLLRASDELPQAILLDLNMDMMGGAEFRKLQCADPLLRNIPVIVVSGDEDTMSIRMKMNSEVIQKPFSISSIMEALERNTKLH